MNLQEMKSEILKQQEVLEEYEKIKLEHKLVKIDIKNIEIKNENSILN